MAGRVYAAEPPPGPIELALGSMTPLQRIMRRAQEHGNLQPGASFILDGIEVQLIDPIRLNPDILDQNGNVVVPAGVGIQMRLRARDAVTLELLPTPLDNRYRFWNPPIKAPNGTWRILEDGTEVENMEERPMQAMKRMVLDAVLLRARQLGWVG